MHLGNEKRTHACAQFLTRPFIVGDRVELKTTGGGTVLTGIVERIDVMRTLIRTDKSIPVAVPNRSITEMIVSNESRLGRSNVTANFKVGNPLDVMRACALLDIPLMS